MFNTNRDTRLPLFCLFPSIPLFPILSYLLVTPLASRESKVNWVLFFCLFLVSILLYGTAFPIDIIPVNHSFALARKNKSQNGIGTL